MSELSNIEMKNTEIISSVLLNISKLFKRRGYDNIPDDIIKEIHTNKMANFKLGTIKFSINILNQDIKNI